MKPDLIIRALKTAGKSLVFFLGLAIFMILIALGTEAGSAWTVKRAMQLVSDSSSYELSFEEMNGVLLDELTFSNLNIRDIETGMTMTAGNISVTWRPVALFDHGVHIRNFEASQVVLDLPEVVEGQDDAPEKDIAAVLQGFFSLPVTIQLDQAMLVNISIRNGVTQRIASVSLAAKLDSQSLGLQATLERDAASSIATDLELSSNTYALEGTLDWRTVMSEMAFNGSLSLGGSLEELLIEHTLLAPVSLTSSGFITSGLLDGSLPAIELQHEIRDFVGAGFAQPGLDQIESLTGRITTAGTIEQLDLQGELQARLRDFGELASTFDVSYQSDAIRLNQVYLDSQRLTLSASGEYDLSAENSLSLDWTLENFTDGDLLESLELVSVEGRGSINIDFAYGQRKTLVRIADLAGEINSFPLSGAGEVSLLDNSIEEMDVNLAAGGNSLALSGLITPVMDLQWNLQAPALNRILSTLQGQANGAGRLSGTLALPQLNGIFNGTGIRYADESVQLQLDRIQAEARYDGSDNRVELDFVNLIWGAGEQSVVFPRGELLASGTLPAHQVALETTSSLGNFQLEAAGGYQQQSWDGEISAADIQSIYGDWQLTQPLFITASADQATLSEHCWAMTSFSACAQVGWMANVGASGEIILDDFPLSYLNNRQLIEDAGMNDILDVLDGRPRGLEDLMDEYAISLPPSSFIDGRVDVESSFAGLGAAWQETSLNVVLSPRDLLLGVVIEATEDSASPELRVESYGLDEVQLELNRESALWILNASFQIYVPEADGLDFQGAFNGQATLDDNESLGGNFELGFNNIAWLEALVPNLLDPRGELQASGQITGNLTRPLLVFDANLAAGSFELPEYGLFLSGLELALHSEQDNEITITGQASSGAGQVSFNSQITTPFLNSRTMQLEVVGEDFQIINIPGTQVTVNPDLVLKYDNNTLDINGSLLMPQFDLDISSNMTLVGNGSVSVSRDVVVVNLPPELEGSVNTPDDGLLGLIPITANVMLGLGDEVRFRGFGLDLQLNGELMLEQSIDRPLLAYGELAIPNGSYGLYGQRLTIENGKLLFLGNPLNPAVDIRALRQTPNAIVGLQLNGTIRNLQGQLFSVPGLPESEILSLLVTGRSFQNAGNQEGANMLNAIALLSLEKGNGLTNSVRKGLGLDMVDISTSDDYRDSALGLGKYLRPNLFMRYDIGLFDRENTLTLEYILTERIKLEVETGVSQSVDLTYTVEK